MRSEAEAEKLVPEKFHKWIKVFGKKQSDRKDADKKGMGLCDKCEGRVCTKEEKVYLLSREKREEVREFVKEQLRK